MLIWSFKTNLNVKEILHPLIFGNSQNPYCFMSNTFLELILNSFLLSECLTAYT